MRFTATVQTGIGEGAQYVQKYADVFEQQLSEEFFPGTLNVQTDEVVRLSKGIEIMPPHEGLHEVTCYKVRINDTSGYIVVPTIRRHGPDTFELLAPVSLREKYGLQDGDEVVCELD